MPVVGRAQRACWAKGAMWHREQQGCREDAEERPRPSLPDRVGNGDTLVVSWGLQHWAEAKIGSRKPHTLTLTLAIHPQLSFVFLVLQGKESLIVGG